MPTALETRISRLETVDTELVLLRTCEHCGRVVRSAESYAWGDAVPPCTQGQPHSPIPPPSPRDITIARSYARPEPAPHLH